MDVGLGFNHCKDWDNYGGRWCYLDGAEKASECSGATKSKTFENMYWTEDQNICEAAICKLKDLLIICKIQYSLAVREILADYCNSIPFIICSIYELS